MFAPSVTDNSHLVLVTLARATGQKAGRAGTRFLDVLHASSSAKLAYGGHPDMRCIRDAEKKLYWFKPVGSTGQAKGWTSRKSNPGPPAR